MIRCLIGAVYTGATLIGEVELIREWYSFVSENNKYAACFGVVLV